MLKISAYTVSNENLDETIPSPLIDGDVAPAVVPEMPVEYAPAELQPIEQSVVLPPHLDPTPVDPLSADIIQEEVIAENLETEAGQLMGASIALEGYAQLLKSSGKNMTRQSAAFMAVGMRRANRLLPGASLGLENEESGTQVMAMQQSKVDEKGLGAKLKEGAAKVWEWILKQVEKLKAQLAKMRAFFSKEKEKIEYLIGFAGAVESGNPAKLKALEAPAGLKTASVAENVESFEKPSGKSVRLTPGEISLFVSGGKLDLSAAGALQLAKTELPAYITKATAYGIATAKINSELTSQSTPDEAASKLEEAVKSTVGSDPVEIKVTEHAVYTRDAEGFVKFDSGEGSGTDEVALPDVAAIKQFLAHLQEIIKVENSTEASINKMLETIMSVSQTRDTVANRIGEDLFQSIIVKVMAFQRRPNFDTCNNVESIKRILGVVTKNGVALADKLLAAHAGHDGTISQEDFEALPSRGLSVIPGQTASGPGLMQRGLAAGQELWRKMKEFFARLWAQFSEWAKNLWARITGVGQKTEVLLLTNNAVPEGGEAPGDVATLPPGTRLKSVQAARALGGPSAAGPVVDDVVATTPVAPTTPGIPSGMVVVPEAVELMVNGQLAFDPSWEEAMANWLIKHYIPTQEKIVRDLTSFAGSSELDEGLYGIINVVKRATPQLFEGMPTQPAPGLRTIEAGEGCKLQVRQEGFMSDPGPIKILKKRQIDQALARQKKLLIALGGIEKSRLVIERQRAALNALLDRRVAAGVPEANVTQFYNYMERNVMVSSAAVIVAVITKICEARVAVADAMIVARAQGRK